MHYENVYEDSFDLDDIHPELNDMDDPASILFPEEDDL